ncbi:MAG TPA: carbohydrate binding domain-containing protein, partial [Polyangia bacterium]
GMRVRGMESSPMGWGANLVVPVAGIADCYDATVYGGLEFWIRGKAGSKVSVAIQSAQVRALSRDLVGFWRGIVTVTGSWKKETIRFADLMIDYGAPPPFDVTKVTGLGFEPILDPMDATTRSFDFTIDNVAFVK